MRQLRQKNSAVSGAGSRRQSAQTGTRENRYNGRSQTWHSSGNRIEKRPWGTCPKIGGIRSESDKARLLLEKTHLPVILYFTTKPSRLTSRVHLLREVIVDADLVDDVQLPFQIVDVMFFVQKNLLE